MKNVNLHVSNVSICHDKISDKTDGDNLNNLSCLTTDEHKFLNSMVKDFAKSIEKDLNVFSANEKLKESEIIHELVYERFGNSFRRNVLKKMVANPKETRLSEEVFNSTPLQDNYVAFHETSAINNLSKHEESSCEEYDPNRFLQAALGEEITQYGSILCMNDDTAESVSVGTSDLSALLSKASSRGTFTSRTNYYSVSSKTNQTPILEVEEEGKRQRLSLSSLIAVENRILNLAKERAVQEEITEQIFKALSFCTQKKEFFAGIEHVEAERALLVAVCRRELILEEVNRLQYNYIEETDVNLGRIRISSIKFSPKESALSDHGKDFTQWFVCVLQNEHGVYATKAIAASGDGSVNFKEEFEFASLPSDFTINLSLYSMRIRNNIRSYSHESKFNLKEKPTTCPTLRIPTPKRKKAATVVQIHNRPSAFTLWGQGKITIACISKSSYVELQNVPRSSTLLNFANVSMKSCVELKDSRKGFVTLGRRCKKGMLNWNLCWCSLRGAEFSYWNSPHDEGVKPPSGVLDLGEVFGEKVEKADRSLCPRPRTLVFDVVSKKSGRDCAERCFLAFETAIELREWERSLNSVLSTLKNWNCRRL